MIKFQDIKLDEKAKKEEEDIKEKIDELIERKFKTGAEEVARIIWEELYSLKYQFCEAVVAYLLGNSSQYLSENKSFIEEYIGSIGYTAKAFRKKIFEENKEKMLKDITDDFIYGRLEDSFKKYFENWDYRGLERKDIPQSKIIRQFAKYFIKNIDNYSEILNKEIDKKLLEKNEELKRLKGKINNLRNRLNY